MALALLSVATGLTVARGGAEHSPASGFTLLKDSYPRIGEPEQFAREADVVARGVIESIGGDRWTTRDGKAPPGLFQGVPTGGHFIYRTGVLRVEEIVSGRVEASKLLITVEGGRVGDVEMFANGSGTLAAGNEVVVFLVAPGSTQAVRLANDSTWYPIEFYRVDSARDIATHEFHPNIPVDTLIERVRGR